MSEGNGLRSCVSLSGLRYWSVELLPKKFVLVTDSSGGGIVFGVFGMEYHSLSLCRSRFGVCVCVWGGGVSY